MGSFLGGGSGYLATTAIMVGALSAWLSPITFGAEPARTLLLRTGAVRTDLEPSLMQAPLSAYGAGPYILQLDGPMTPHRREQLRNVGVVFLTYIPQQAYIVRLGEVEPAKLAEISYVKWVGVFRDEWRIDPNIGTRPFSSASRIDAQERGRVRLVLHPFADTDIERALADLSGLDVAVKSVEQSSRRAWIGIEIDLEDTRALSTLPWLQFAEAAPEGTPRNDTNAWIVQSNMREHTPVWDHGLHGEGQIGGLIDEPVFHEHCAFDDEAFIGPQHRKIIAYRGPFGASDHGTHVAGTFVGDAGLHGQRDTYDGMAFAAKMSFTNGYLVWNEPETLLARLTDAYVDGARVHSNSWGDDFTTAYTIWCQQIDQFSRDFEDACVVVATTNGSLLRTPENAKNVLAVGATLDFPQQDDHWSGGIGPTSDGRLKPEVYAPGAQTMSADGQTTCDWFEDYGTSMACPVVAGAGLLVRQYFVEGFYPDGYPLPGNIRTPTGALIRAVLINSAVDMTGVQGYPTFLEGWGRVRLDETLYFPGDNARLHVVDVRNDDGLATGESMFFTITVRRNSTPLRVTLAWTDVPAAINASFAPVNDLNLRVTSPAPNNPVYPGNVFNQTDGQSLPVPIEDHINNVEQVHLHQPMPGIYLVEVRGIAVNVERQGFALVVTGDTTPAIGDCNNNGIPDDIDIENGTSQDCNQNDRPDECEPDCNENGLPDPCELLSGTSPDCDGNNVPDDCQPNFDQDDQIDACDEDVDNDGLDNDDDACDFTPLGEPIRDDGSHQSDVNSDCRIDLIDYRFFDGCLKGSGPVRGGGAPMCVLRFDRDNDNDVDFRDFARFSLLFTEPES